MKKHLTVTTALAALMLGVSAPAFAASHETPAENAAENAGQAMENAGEATENAAEATENAVEGAATATENAAENAGEAMENAAEEAGEAMENTAENAGEAMNNAAEAVVFMPYDAATQLTSDEIVGMKVEGSDGERVGDVNQVVLSTSGEALGIVVGVGGFLGIGEKDVAVSFDRIQFAQDEGMAERKIVLTATKEELEAAPAYERTN